MKDNKPGPVLEKIFSAVIAADVLGRATNVKVECGHAETAALVEALTATSAFQKELNSPTATIASVMQRLGEKHVAVARFEDIVGVRWPV